MQQLGKRSARIVLATSVMTIVVMSSPAFSVVASSGELSANTNVEETATESVDFESVTVLAEAEEKLTWPEEPETETISPEGYVMYYDPELDVYRLAQLVEVECHDMTSWTHIAGAMWVALNRLDSPRFKQNTLLGVLTAPNQFAYRPHVTPREEYVRIAEDVLRRWNDEKNGFTNVGRILPPEACFFWGDGKINHFNNDNNRPGAIYYDVDTESYPSPYNN